MESDLGDFGCFSKKDHQHSKKSYTTYGIAKIYLIWDWELQDVFFDL